MGVISRIVNNFLDHTDPSWFLLRTEKHFEIIVRLGLRNETGGRRMKNITTKKVKEPNDNTTY